jgi:signal transduction histidine kinase
VTSSGNGGAGRRRGSAVGAAALRTVRRLRSARVDRAVMAERRRVARELHDGVVQELGWIRSAALRGMGGQEIAAAADRALAEARRAMSSVAEPEDETAADAVGRTVRAIAVRNGLRLSMVLDPRTEAPRDHRTDLARISGDAVLNAARHSGCEAVEVSLVPGRLRVHDDGVGFDVAQVGIDSHGLVSMRERAEEMGAGLSVRSAPGAGTTVEVVW